jgi:copper chaperone CopZ
MVTETTLAISGMHCGSCAQRLGLVLERHEGVIRATVDPAGAARVRYDEVRLDVEQLGEIVRTAGFDVSREA